MTITTRNKNVKRIIYYALFKFKLVCDIISSQVKGVKYEFFREDIWFI